MALLDLRRFGTSLSNAMTGPGVGGGLLTPEQQRANASQARLMGFLQMLDAGGRGQTMGRGLLRGIQTAHDTRNTLGHNQLQLLQAQQARQKALASQTLFSRLANQYDVRTYQGNVNASADAFAAGDQDVAAMFINRAQQIGVPLTETEQAALAEVRARTKKIEAETRDISEGDDAQEQERQALELSILRAKVKEAETPPVSQEERLRQKELEQRQELRIAKEEKARQALPRLANEYKLVKELTTAVLGGEEYFDARTGDDVFFASVGPLQGLGRGEVLAALGDPSKRDRRRLIEQLSSKAYMQARQALRGGGQITENEAARAEDAITRIGQANVSDEAFIEALFDFVDAVKDGLDILTAEANIPATSDGAEWTIEEN